MSWGSKGPGDEGKEERAPRRLLGVLSVSEKEAKALMTELEISCVLTYLMSVLSGSPALFNVPVTL